MNAPAYFLPVLLLFVGTWVIVFAMGFMTFYEVDSARQTVDAIATAISATPEATK